MRWYDAIASSITERHAFIKEYQDLSKRLDENLANAQNFPLLVLVIGESTQRNYLSLYGYPLPTIPRLESPEQAGNLVLFRDFISLFPNTDRSLQRALILAIMKRPYSVVGTTKPY